MGRVIYYRSVIWNEKISIVIQHIIKKSFLKAQNYFSALFKT